MAPGQHIISIHALLTESDELSRKIDINPNEFQSTLSSRRATPLSYNTVWLTRISIHALLTESD